MLRVVLRHQRRPASPVYEGDFPDPFVLVTGGRSFAYGTQTGDVNVQVMESPDLAAWRHRGDALPELPSWAGPGRTWAPAVLRREAAEGSGRASAETYVLYYALRYEAAGRQAVSVATASAPAGPFVDRSSEPLIYQEDRAGSIDPSPFVDEDGAAYLLWKSDDNAVDRPASLWGAPLRPDGLALAGEPTELLRHDAAWEEPLVEAPSLARVGEGAYVLFYSGGWWESGRYGIGYATGPGPLGPFHKETRDAPWVASAQGMAGPGGAEVFRDAGGGWRLAFHAWTPPRVGYGEGGARSLWIERLEFTGGRPVLH
jgi:Glycosyl hydrolases family 43